MLQLIKSQECPSCKSDISALKNLSPPPLFCPQCQFPIIIIAGKYELIKKLAEGGFAAAYLARHILLKKNSLRVVKRLKPELFKNKELKKRFLREVQITSELSMENDFIVKIYDDFGELPNFGLFYVMEYLGGKDLFKFFKDRKNLQFLEDIFDQICAGIEFAHQNGIIHRDLKPENIFIIKRSDNRYRAKILDFGIAKQLDKTTQNITKGTVGTPLYMAPEQIRNSQVTPQTDLYSLAIILYEALTEQHPLFSKNELQTLSHLEILTGHLVRKPRPQPPEILPPELFKIIATALKKKPQERYPSVQEFWKTIKIPLTKFLIEKFQREKLPISSDLFPVEKTLPVSKSPSELADSPPLYSPKKEKLSKLSYSSDEIDSITSTPSMTEIATDIYTPHDFSPTSASKDLKIKFESEIPSKRIYKEKKSKKILINILFISGLILTLSGLLYIFKSNGVEKNSDTIDANNTKKNRFSSKTPSKKEITRILPPPPISKRHTFPDFKVPFQSHQKERSTPPLPLDKERMTSDNLSDDKIKEGDRDIPTLILKNRTAKRTKKEIKASEVSIRLKKIHCHDGIEVFIESCPAYKRSKSPSKAHLIAGEELELRPDIWHCIDFVNKIKLEDQLVIVLKDCQTCIVKERALGKYIQKKRSVYFKMKNGKDIDEDNECLKK